MTLLIEDLDFVPGSPIVHHKIWDEKSNSNSLRW